jgi:hypothetical protein
MPARPGVKIDTDQYCSYGCGNTALFINKKGNLMCAEFSNGCPAIKKKNSVGGKNAYKTGKRPPAALQYQNLSTDSKNKMSWAKGLTKDTDASVMAWTIKLSSKRYITDEEKLKRTIYKEQCDFNLAGCIENVRGYDLLVKHGMYHRKTNPGGVVRDHRISVNYGYKNNIDPKIISHPANCEFLLHSQNAKKSFKNSCTIENLLDDITKWDCEGNRYTLLVENQ